MTTQDAESFGTVIGIIIVAILQQWNAYQTRVNIKETAAKLEVVDAEKAKKVSDIHALVNSGMSEQLRMVMMLSQRVADASKSPDDLVIAEQAKSRYNDHMNGQATVDAAKAREDAAFAAGALSVKVPDKPAPTTGL